MQAKNDRINLVNENDEIVAESDKIKAHLGNGLLHQAISLFLFYKNNEGKVKLLMQQRSSKKIVGAKTWANTVCGNVAVGENHRECVVRRLREELGIELPVFLKKKIKDLITFKYQVKCNEKYSENELDHIFALEINKDELDKYFSLKLNPDEVVATSWVDWPITNLKDKELTPWFKIFLNSLEVMKSLNSFLQREET